MRRNHQIVWIAWFVALIASVPVTQGVVEVSRGRAPRFLDLFTRMPVRTNLRAFEKELEDDSLFARAARPWIQYTQFRLFGDAGEKVLAGRDGWLFYRPDVEYLLEPAALAEDPLSAILQFRDQLRTREIRLMVLPVPGKPSVYSQMLTRRVNGPVHSPTRELIALLRGAGVEAVDLFDLFGNSAADHPLYLKRDTHWTAAAAELAAERVAARLKELDWVDQGGIEFGVRNTLARRPSDIARMTRVPLIEASFPPEEVACRQVFDPTSGGLYKDDPASPVLVLGDSFLRIYETDEPRAAGFIAHLARNLKRPLASIVNDGGASTLVRQELARRPQLLAGKKVVIWEFVERDLRFGTDGWKPAPLTLSRNP